MFQELRGRDLPFTMSHRGQRRPQAATAHTGNVRSLAGETLAEFPPGVKRLRCPDHLRWDHRARPACRARQARLDRQDLPATRAKTATQDQWGLPAPQDLRDLPEHQLKLVTESSSATAAP